jgi:hypothetical protein
MRAKGMLVILVLTIFFAAFTAPERADKGWIYGKIYTEYDDVYEGRIRWDKNEVFWDDILNAYREATLKEKKASKEERTVVDIFGIKIRGKSVSNRQLLLRFGMIKSIERTSSNRAEIELKNGERIIARASSTDLGNSVRGIVINDADEGKLKLRWRDLEKVEFFPEPEYYAQKVNDPRKRLYGKVDTDEGDFEGFIVWDVDESVTTDILDGEERGVEREIEFGRIRSIEKRFSDSSLVTLKSGKELKLEGSNDVNDDNRGITIVDVTDNFEVKVSWDAFRSIEFIEGKEGLIRTYNDIKTGKPLKGKIYARNGKVYKGYIKWDNDEESTQDYLDGELDGIDFTIEFSSIKSIARRSNSSAIVTLKSGREFVLSDTVDVSDNNRGIFVWNKEEGKTRLSWRDFEKAEFE